MFFNTENLFKFAYHLTNQPKPNTMTNYITVQTKGNYKHANGIKLEVVQFLSHMISAKVPEYGFDGLAEACFRWPVGVW